LHLGV